MTIDGGLRPLFKRNLTKLGWDFQAIETGGTGQGIPDANACLNGHEAWLEFKVTSTNAVGLRPEQVGWIERRTRHGGRVFICIRQTTTEGPRKGEARDALIIVAGRSAQVLAQYGLDTMLVPRLVFPVIKNINWEFVSRVLQEGLNIADI